MEKRKDPHHAYLTLEKRNGSLVLFKNPRLERHSHVHPITPLVFWTPIIAYLLYHSYAKLEIPVTLMGAIGILALFVWTFTEYVLHRWVFHFTPWGPKSAWVSYLIHWVHHDEPTDKTRLVMPPVAAVVIASVLWVIFRLFTGPVYIYPFFAFFLIGYLIYDYTHYALHHFRPRTALGRHLKKLHMHHHFVNPDSYWGVSSPIWDYVFGTAAPLVKSASRSMPQHQESESTA